MNQHLVMTFILVHYCLLTAFNTGVIIKGVVNSQCQAKNPKTNTFVQSEDFKANQNTCNAIWIKYICKNEFSLINIHCKQLALSMFTSWITPLNMVQVLRKLALQASLLATSFAPFTRSNISREQFQAETWGWGGKQRGPNTMSCGLQADRQDHAWLNTKIEA